MKKLLIFLIFAIPIGVMAGHHASGGNSLTISSNNVNIRVLQWLDVVLTQESVTSKQIRITDYSGEYSRDPQTDYLAEIENIDTNATGLLMTVTGFFEDETCSQPWDYNSYLQKKWLLYRWAPTPGNYVPITEEWMDFSTSDAIICLFFDSDYSGTEGASETINNITYYHCGKIDIDGVNRYGLSIKLVTIEGKTKYLPAGSYNLYFLVIFLPYVTFQ